MILLGWRRGRQSMSESVFEFVLTLWPAAVVFALCLLVVVAEMTFEALDRRNR